MPAYDYASILNDSLKVAWKVEDIIGADKPLDFTRPFLPESLAGVSGIRCLNAREKLTLNHIRGSSYLHLFGFVEEFILPFVMDHTRKLVHGDHMRLRALLTFADEEAKHMHLFKRFSEEFAKGFSTKCEGIGPASEAAAAILKHSTLGVGLVILHLEWMTQKHYVESVRTDESLDPQFCSLLRHHWMEEAQHARLDTLMVEELAKEATADQLDTAVDDYLAIGNILDGGCQAQIQLDLAALAKETGRTFTEEEKKEISDAQLKSYRYTFLGSGMTHPHFVKSLGQVSAKGAARVAEVAKALG